MRTLTKFLSISITIVTCLAVPALAQTVHWKCTTSSHPWFDEPDVTSNAKSTTAPAETITIDSDKKFQTIQGWGGCFNERGWRAMQILSPEAREKAMRAMFEPNDGLKLNLCRTPIASSDYAIELYSYDETLNDFDMSRFSIDRDHELLIPYIKAAMALRKDLKIWAVPWSPPSWMKNSNKLAGGHIKTDPQTMSALALYFQKYVQAYRAEGIPLYMVMPQNEPCYSTGYSSSEWTGEQLAIFVRDYLGPTFKRANLDCEIWMGTFARSDKLNDYDHSLAPALIDPTCRAFINGVGCQWSADKVMHEAHEKYPDLQFMQTEAECGKTNTNDWLFATQRFDQMVKYFDAGAQSFMIWNLVLDETGLSTANWAQCSPIVVNQKTKEVNYTPYFYMYEHFSHFVSPGAVRIDASSANAIAFQNPDGTTIVVVKNSENTEKPITITLGKTTASRDLPANSFNTFVFDKTAAN